MFRDKQNDLLSLNTILLHCHFFKALSHGAIVLATCNAILRMFDVFDPNPACCL